MLSHSPLRFKYIGVKDGIPLVINPQDKIGFFTTIGTIWGGGELSEKDLYRHFARSLRQGLLLSGAMVLSLYLLAVDLFSLFTMTIVISLVIFLEVVFLLSDARQEK